MRQGLTFYESARELINMLIFPDRLASLEDHTLRHFSEESNLGSN